MNLHTKDPIEILEERFWTPIRIAFGLAYVFAFITLFYVLTLENTL